MKEALTKNWTLKVLALGFSFLLWLVVVNIQDPVVTRKYNGVPVTIEHAEIITNRGNTYQVLTDSITVEVSGKRSNMEKVKVGDIVAIADMKNLDTKSNSLIPIEVSVNPPNTNDTFKAVSIPGNLEIKIEANKTKTFPIMAETTGSLKKGYVLGDTEVTPATIEISGPESLISIINKVTAKVNVDGRAEDGTLPAELVVYDGNGKTLDLTRMEYDLGDEGLSVNVSLLKTKEVSVLFSTSGIQVADGYILENVTVEPEKIEIVGDPIELEKIESIRIPADALRETDLTETVDRTIDIADYIPVGFSVTDETVGVPVLVKISVVKAGTRVFEFPVASIYILSAPEGYKMSYGTTGNVSITVTGAQEDLDAMEELGQGSVSIDLAGIKTAGKYTVPLQVVLPKGVELEQEITIDVSLTAE